MATSATSQPAAGKGPSLLDKLVTAGGTLANAYAAQQIAKTATKSTKGAGPYVVAGLGIVAVAVVAVVLFRRK